MNQAQREEHAARVKKLDQVLLHGTASLEELGIPFVLTGGTLLGIVRDRTLLHWDKDVDLDAHYDDVMEKSAKLEKSGFVYSGGYYVKAFPEYGLKLDLFMIKKKKSVAYKEIGYNENHPTNKSVTWPWKCYNKRNWDHIYYKGYKYNVPGYIFTHLRTFFGKDWQESKPEWGWDSHCKNKTTIDELRRKKWTI